jgi:hypothetical protein
MLLDKVEVTFENNVNENGELIDEDIIGFIFSEQMLQAIQQDPKSGQAQTVALPRIGVLWDHQRSPAVSYHDPAELYWLGFEGDEPELDEDDEEITLVPERQVVDVKSASNAKRADA